MSFSELIKTARDFHRNGQISEAENLCRQILTRDLNHPEALPFLGIMAAETGKKEDAVALLSRAITLRFQPLEQLYYCLGQALQGMGRLDEALASYDETIKLNTKRLDALCNRGIILRALGQDQAAEATYIYAIQTSPQVPGPYFHLGNLLRDHGKPVEAIECFEKALILIEPFVQSVAPLWRSRLHNNLGLAFADVFEYEKAAEHFKQAIALTPDLSFAYHNYGNILRNQGEYEKALDFHARALEINPEYVEARWAYTIATIPLLFDKAEDVEPSRLRLDKELTELDCWFHDERMAYAPTAVGYSQPYFLAYQEENNRALLSKYGALCCRLMKDWFDKKNFLSVPVKTEGLVRVGIVSSHVFDHSVWRVLVKGWLQHYDRSKFEIHILCPGLYKDDETLLAQSQVTSFQNISTNLDVSVQTIMSKNFDVLIFPDIGMDPTTLRLGSLRLCPVQIASWGHPETSGLPTMDYYLSAEAFEPPEADMAYSEKLIRLPHLGCCYQPRELSYELPDLSRLGINPKLPLLLSPGMSFKYAPAHDHVFVDIARCLGDCQIVFFTSHDGLTNRLQMRLKAAFEAAGLEFNRFCLFIPWQKPPAFYGLMKQATLFLDTLGFSGFNTAIQAIECGLPVITQEGRFMRGRLASGILNRMGLSELVAGNKQDYVEKVVRMVQDSPYREGMRKRIVEDRHILFEDYEPLHALEDFLLRTVRPNTPSKAS